MASIRVKCQCDNTFRSPKASEWASLPVPPANQYVPDGSGGQGLKTKKGALEPGRHVSKHTLCRACYKAKNNRSRPTGRA
jgi:hypothetical protein